MSFGSQRGFLYQTDNSQNYSIRADESNIELVNLTPQPPSTGLVGLPRDIKPRRIKLVSESGSTKVIPILGAAAYNTIAIGETFVTTPTGEENGGAVTFTVVQKIPERILRRAYAPDTGKNDGDNP